MRVALHVLLFLAIELETGVLPSILTRNLQNTNITQKCFAIFI